MIRPPSLSTEDNTRDCELDTDAAEMMLGNLAKYEYASLRHVTLFWRTLTRRGAARAMDLRDYDSGDQYVELVHRPATDTPLKNGERVEQMISLRIPVPSWTTGSPTCDLT